MTEKNRHVTDLFVCVCVLKWAKARLVLRFVLKPVATVSCWALSTGKVGSALLNHTLKRKHQTNMCETAAKQRSGRGFFNLKCYVFDRLTHCNKEAAGGGGDFNLKK